MKVGVLTRNEEAWCSQQLKAAIAKRGLEPFCFRFPRLMARVGLEPKVSFEDVDLLKELAAIIVRPVGRGSLDECIFRMDILHRLARLGMVVVNHPSAIEKCIDKYYSLTILEEKGVPVPKTVVAEAHVNALKAFYELGCDVVIKPIFGSRGIGSTRVTDPEVASRIFRSLEFMNHVIYIQEFIAHGTRDIRAFIIGDRAVASIYREAQGWKTNVAQGARPIATKLNGYLEDLAVKASMAVGCDVAGVDILEGPKGPVITEVNSQPGWKGLQSVVKINIAEEIINHVIHKAKR